MPLIACPECQRAVSDKASACPTCGAPFKNRSGVIVRGVDIPFGQLVELIFKTAVASIPAAIIFVIFMTIVLMALAPIIRSF